MQSPNIKDAKVIQDKKLLLTFTNGEEKIFDMNKYLRYPIFKELEEQGEFEKFRLIDGTIEWECGADLSQDTFYLESVSVQNVETLAREL